jgi:hypothetical protein
LANASADFVLAESPKGLMLCGMSVVDLKVRKRRPLSPDRFERDLLNGLDWRTREGKFPTAALPTIFSGNLSNARLSLYVERLDAQALKSGGAMSEHDARMYLAWRACTGRSAPTNKALQRSVVEAWFVCGRRR